MKTNQLLITLVLIAAVLLAGCSSQARVGALRTESQSVELGDARSVRVEINLGAGNLELTGGAEKLLEAGFTYNVDKLKPEVEYTGGTSDLKLAGLSLSGLNISMGAGNSTVDLSGAWWFFGLFVVSSVFTPLGEDFLFRGVLLPKMEGVFGRWSWLANGVLFGLYHVHAPWSILQNVISGPLILAFPSWRYRSTWMAVIVHSAQSVYFGVLILGLVLGLA